MGITVLHMATVLVLFLMLYKYLGPIAQDREEKEEEEEDGEGIELGPVRNGGGGYELLRHKSATEEGDLSSEAEAEEDAVPLLSTSGKNSAFDNSMPQHI